MATPDDPLYEQFSIEFMRLAENTTPILLSLRPLEAWIILSHLQLALRHPENVGESARVARRIAEQLQAFVAPSGALREVARRGWDAAYDAPREEQAR